MVKFLPFDNPEFLNKNKTITEIISPNKLFGFIRLMVKTVNKNKLPLHAYRCPKVNKLLFPIFNNWTEITIFSDEYYRGLKTGIYQYQILDSIKFGKKKILKKVTIDIFKKKEKAEKENNKAIKQVQKICLNSLYGFWGLRTRDRDGVIINKKNENSWLEHFHKGKLYNVLESEQYTLMNIQRDLDVKTYNVAIAAAITSYSRTYLYDLITDIQEAGGKVHYADTDSVMCDIDISKYPDIMKKYMWDGIDDLSKAGKELGSLKNEADEEFYSTEALIAKKAGLSATLQKKAGKNFVKEQIKKDGGLIYFDKMILGGLKYYALQRKIDGKTIEICKCKGYSKKDKKLRFIDFENMINEKQIPITQKQTQFKNPITNHLNKDNFMGICTQKVVKKFRVQYTKGIVDSKTNNINTISVN